MIAFPVAGTSHHISLHHDVNIICYIKVKNRKSFKSGASNFECPEYLPAASCHNYNY